MELTGIKDLDNIIKGYVNELNLHNIAHTGLVFNQYVGIAALATKGIGYESLQNYIDDPYIKIVFREPKLLDNLGVLTIRRIAETYIGTKYDFRLILGFMIANSLLFRWLTTKKFKDRILKFFDDKKKFICSEFGLFLCKSALFTYDSNYRITPIEFFSRFNANFNDLAMKMP